MMHLLKCRLNHGLVALAAFAALTPQAIKAQTLQICSVGNSVMRGIYVMSGNGTVVGVGPVVMVGEVIYNGDGTGTLLSVKKNVNGMVFSSSSVPITYSVNPDCTGSKTVSSGASANHFDFVITPDGATITWVGTDANAIISGKATRFGR
jgi:hypothetical protein